MLPIVYARRGLGRKSQEEPGGAKMLPIVDFHQARPPGRLSVPAALISSARSLRARACAAVAPGPELPAAPEEVGTVR